MIGTVVFTLCAVTAGLCAALLLREYWRRPTPLLLWSGLSFVGFAISNLLVFTDFVIMPAADLSTVRAISALVSIGVLVYGLVRNAD